MLHHSCEDDKVVTNYFDCQFWGHTAGQYQLEIFTVKTEN